MKTSPSGFSHRDVRLWQRGFFGDDPPHPLRDGPRVFTLLKAGNMLAWIGLMSLFGVLIAGPARTSSDRFRWRSPFCFGSVHLY